MNPQQTQAPSPADVHNQALNKASVNLGFITRMHKELIDHKQKTGQFPTPQTPQNAPGQEQTQETPKDELKPEEAGLAKLEGKFEQGIKDLGDTIRAGFDKLGKDKE